MLLVLFLLRCWYPCYVVEVLAVMFLNRIKVQKTITAVVYDFAVFDIVVPIVLLTLPFTLLFLRPVLVPTNQTPWSFSHTFIDDIFVHFQASIIQIIALIISYHLKGMHFYTCFEHLSENFFFCRMISSKGQ